MNRIKNILVALAVASLTTLSAFGQGRGLDVFKATRLINLGVTNGGAGGSSSVTNAYQDVHLFDGYSTIFLWAATNQTAGAGTNLSLTCGIYLSPDQTNWNVLTNFCVVTSNTTFVVTNLNYGGNTNYLYATTNGLLATNTYLYPATWTVPSASTAGFATPYPSEAGWGYTNGGLITLSNSSSQYAVGFDMGAISTQSTITTPPRYLRLVWNLGASNYWAVGGTLVTYPHQSYP
jgi:hypothetical protein